MAKMFCAGRDTVAERKTLTRESILKKALVLSIILNCGSAYADWECTSSSNGMRRIYSEPYDDGDCKRVGPEPETKRKAAKPKTQVAPKKGVSIGMTQQEVLASSWGKPKDINRTTNAYGVREQWVYGGRNYLYFKDGILTSIQN